VTALKSSGAFSHRPISFSSARYNGRSSVDPNVRELALISANRVRRPGAGLGVRGGPARHLRPGRGGDRHRRGGPKVRVRAFLSRRPASSAIERDEARPRRQHREEVEVVIDSAAAPQLGAVVNDAADSGTDQGPAAEGVGPHELADPECEPHVGVEAPVYVRRRVEGGGPNRYPPPGRLERVRHRQEAVHERRVHDNDGMDVRRDGRVIREDGKRSVGQGRAAAVISIPTSARRSLILGTYASEKELYSDMGQGDMFGGTRTRPAHSRQAAGITHPAGDSVERTCARSRTARPMAIGDLRKLLPRTSICPPRFRLRHRLRGGNPPQRCSSSCFSSSSMPSRMNDDAFLYFVYGTSSLMNSHVA
jgi:hypothetical protein